jgi:nitronate monooxygenase
VNSLLSGLDLEIPVVAAPMSGGPTTPSMVVAAARAGGFGFLAGGYKTADLLAEQIREVRRSAPNFGVNLFAPNPLPVDPAEFRSYADAIRADAELYGFDSSASTPREDDDQWTEKIDLLLADPVPAVSFTFGIPDRSVITSLSNAGSLIIQTVTSPDEARLAAERGADVVAVQGTEAGGHYGTITPKKPLENLPPLTDLLRQVSAAVDIPLIAAGGIADAAGVRRVLDAGAVAGMIGTVLLRTHESGASDTYKARLERSGSSRTIVTRAFTGRPARGLPNAFTERYDPVAPFGYPAIHHLTSPIRRSAAEAGDPERINLWAGIGHKFAREESVGETMLRMAEGC